MTEQVVTVALESCEPVYVAPGGWHRRDACTVDDTDEAARMAWLRSEALGAAVSINPPSDPSETQETP